MDPCGKKFRCKFRQSLGQFPPGNRDIMVCTQFPEFAHPAANLPIASKGAESAAAGHLSRSAQRRKCRNSMPHKNRFRHQQYHSNQPEAPYDVIEPPQSFSPRLPEYEGRLATACEPLVRDNLAAVYLVHGTFAGNDPLGSLTELQRFSPSMAERLRRMWKGLFDKVVGETGNYTANFAKRFQKGLSTAAGRDVPVHRFNWSSQNNHIGRADAAVRLIGELANLAEANKQASAPPRVMLWGHSHGGNSLAIATNLLAADEDHRKSFFHAARDFYRPWLTSQTDMPAWERVEKVLATEHPVKQLRLEVVTFGTPIRYGWESGGYHKLLHIVNHRPAQHLDEHQMPHPLRPLHILKASHGDYVHQFGIAGTNLIPVPLAVRTFLADWRLGSLLQPDVSWRHLIGNYGHAQRVPHEGKTLLVDYQDSDWKFWKHLMGHGSYTRSRWLPFHASEIAKHFYAASSDV